ncbi:unnamed protein product [marine sediment metagenome]|uniref:Uncharacterized protein n=1 Tax=marine sediment metagenome TaxID=412755 RepID=X0V445_9ZZZZ
MLLEFEVEIDPIGMVANQKGFLANPSTVKIERAITYEVNDLPHLRVAEVASPQVIPPACICQMIETNAIYILPLHQIEDSGDLMMI